VPLFDAVTRDHVLAAIDEFDRVGDGEFLSHYGFKPSRGYLVHHDEKTYDSKAILGAAQGFATGTPAAWDEFRGGKDGAAKRLGDLGFEVEFSGGPVDAADLGVDEARSAWTVAARDVLIEVAGHYRSLVSQKELGAKVQARTGIQTSQALRIWLPAVLERVARACADRDEPLLTSLCVNDSSSVGERYAAAVRSIRGTAPDNADNHAALERLECHRFFGATLPSDGGTALLPERLAASRSRIRKIAAAERVIPVCPKCQTALPATGRCDNCE
jgi:hypothetical protein